jgi:hypothetical protein
MGVVTWPGRTDKEAFRARFGRLLQHEFPDAKITQGGELELEIVFANGARNQIFLGRAYDEFNAQPREFDAIATRWLAMVEPEIPADIDLEVLVPMIQDRAWLAELPDADALWIEDYNEQLVIAYAEHRTGFNYCARDAIEALGQPLALLRQRALDNLAARSQRRIEEHPAGYFISVGGNFEASQILLEDLWHEPCLRGASPVIVAIPDRDTLAVSLDDSPAAVWSIAAVAAKLARSESFPITSLLFTRDGDGLLAAIDSAVHDESHPIPKLDVIDVQAVKDDGSNRLVVVIASPLDERPRSVLRLFTKLEAYLWYVGSDAYRHTYGEASPERTCIELRIHPASASAIFELLQALPEWVQKQGASLIVSTELE